MEMNALARDDKFREWASWRTSTVSHRQVRISANVITIPKRRRVSGWWWLCMFSTTGSSLFPFLGNTGHASTLNEHAQIEGSIAAKAVVWTVTPQDKSGHRH
jgi:hypothetical protein